LTGIVVERVTGPTDAVRLLVGELDAELLQHYPPGQRHGLKLDAIFQPHVRFFIAWTDGQPAGCGGVALFTDFAELKRMYVRPEVRGRGVADAILARLAEQASAPGLSRCGWRLEPSSRPRSGSTNVLASRPAAPSSPIVPCRPKTSPPAYSWNDGFRL
jgi:putative acetyltransferase